MEIFDQALPKLPNGLNILSLYSFNGVLPTLPDTLSSIIWDTSKLRKLYKENDNLAQRGGRKNALNKLASVTKKRFGD
jgi:hypothetical protein